MTEESKPIFQIGDKVKKTIYVGYQFPGEKHFQQEESVYGKIIDYFYRLSVLECLTSNKISNK